MHRDPLQPGAPACQPRGPGIPDPSSIIASRSPDFQIPRAHHVIAKPILGGLHHEYRLEAVAA